MANHKGPQRAVASNKSAIVAKLPAACKDEGKAVEFMEEQRWGETPHCPRCGDVEVKQMTAKDGSRSARYLWRCTGCKRQYTVRVGTIMEDSPIPLRHWCYAFWAACAGKKGVSALQIQRMTGLSYKSALFMMHRIRWAMTGANEPETKLDGIVEFDETFVGGKPRKLAAQRVIDGVATGRKRGPAPDFKDRKTAVVAGVERGGRVKARTATDVTGDTLPMHLNAMVQRSAHLMTDERPAYVRLGRAFAQHDSVNHSEGEYARGNVTTNSVEGFFANLKRAIIGTHHAVSKKHLHRYVAESEFKYNSRFIDDGARTQRAIQGGEGMRLTHKTQTRG